MELEVTLQTKVKDWIEIYHYRNGELLAKYQSEDLVTNVGLNKLAGLLTGLHTSAFKYVALGSGTTAPSATQTSLDSEIVRVEGSVSTVTTSIDGDTGQIVGSFNFTSTNTLTEIGLFDSASGGNMLFRQTFPPSVVLSGDSWILTCKVQFTR